MASIRSTESEGEKEVESGGGAAWRETPVSAVPARAFSLNPTRLMSYILRLIVILFTLLAAIVMGVAKETVIINDVSSDYTLEGEFKSTYNSSFVYFIIVNTLACLYSAVSVGISFTNQSNPNIYLPLSIADLVVAILLFTGNASAVAIEIVVQKGNNHFGWTKICNYASKFCDHLTASIVLSTLAAVIYALLLVLSMISFQKKSL